MKHESYRCFNGVHSGESDEMAPSPAAPFACHCVSSVEVAAEAAEEVDADADAVVGVVASVGWSLLLEKNMAAAVGTDGGSRFPDGMIGIDVKTRRKGRRWTLSQSSCAATLWWVFHTCLSRRAPSVESRLEPRASFPRRTSRGC